MTQMAPERERTLRIGELAELTGTTPRTVRFYEEIGVLPAAEDRAPGKRRLYSDADVERLREIVRLRDLLGLSLEEVRELAEAESARAHIRREFQETDDPSERRRLLEEAQPYIERQLELVRARIGELQKLEEDLVARRKRVSTRLLEL